MMQSPLILRDEYMSDGGYDGYYQLWRYSAPWGDLGLDQNNNDIVYEDRDSDPEDYHNDMLPTIPAQEGENTCYVCMDNIPNAMFPDCCNTGICCLCAHRIVTSTQTCPLCRGSVASFRVID